MYYHRIYVLGRSSYVEMESRTTKVAELAEQIGNNIFKRHIVYTFYKSEIKISVFLSYCPVET